MLQIEKTLVSLDISEKNFFCDLNKCKGACCVQGDSGAPLKSEEAEILEKLYPEIKPFLRKEGIEAIESLGKYLIDADGDTVTPLVNNKECAYAVFENGIAKCGIEKAFIAGKISFQKPISCHLYPIRVTKYSTFDALNYHRWEICKPAIENGDKKNIPIYIFLKDALKREYGDAWYEQLQIASTELKQAKNSF
jgi:hypothetical protein